MAAAKGYVPTTPHVNDFYSRFNKRRRRYAATRPPAGLYDPVLDQQLAAAGRGLGDLKQDTELAGARASDDYAIAQNRTRQQAGFSLADLAKTQGREGQDYGLANQALDRRFSVLADAQRQAANAAGLSGGYAAQAAQKRAANRAVDQNALNLAHSRSLQDFGISRNRIVTARDQRLGDLGIGYQRGVEDRTTNLSRAGREYRNYGVDVGESRFFQARNMGWVPPSGRRRRRFIPSGRRTRSLV